MWGSMNKIINQQHAATNCHKQIVCVNQPLLRFSHLRADACKYQTSSDSSKKSTSVLFYQKIPYIKVFLKMELKFLANFIFREIEHCLILPRWGSEPPSKLTF